MWIRSQSKRALLNVSSVHILNDGDMSLMCCVVAGCDYELGVYSTEEKALKVLDQIQKEVEEERFHTIESMGGKDYISHEMLRVYRMPADEDVKA